MEQTVRLAVSERELDDRERSELTKQIEYCLAQLSRANALPKIHLIATSLILISIPIGALCWVFQGPLLAAVASAAILFVGLGGRLLQGLDAKFIQNLCGETIRNNRDILSANKVRTIRCRPASVATIGEGDQTRYVFDIGDGMLLFVDGHPEYSSKRFPNTDFELVSDPRAGHQAVLFRYFTGESIEPSLQLPRSVLDSLEIPAGVMFTFEGQLDAVPEALRSHLAKTDSQADFEPN